MKSPADDFSHVNELIELAIDGSISPEQSQQLNDWIVKDPAVCAHYCEYIQLNVNIERLSYVADTPALPEYEAISDLELWEELACEERKAPAIALTPSEPRRELIQKVVYPPGEKRKMSKFCVFTLLNAAAVVLFFLILRFTIPAGGIEVATLADSFNAKWVHVKGPMPVGTRLPIDKTPVLLSEGLVKLNFDNNAKVVVEGPAEFLVLAADRIGLNYGKVYVTVPKEAIGFSVYTHHAKIIDLGTEFGVAVDTFGDTSLHVVDGKTALLVDKKFSQGSMDVTDGMAMKVVAATSAIVEISYDSQLFVRTFDSDNRLVWKGQQRLSLADLAGGGNGFGTGRVDAGISPLSGRPAGVFVETQSAENTFRPVAFTPYVDGVFLPDGRTQQVISSQGHVFEDCPPTDGTCFNNVLNAIRIVDGQAVPHTAGSGARTTVNCLLLHANMGITYDLEALRGLLPNVDLARFQSTFRIEKETVFPDLSNVDFWVLVDGELRYQRTQVKAGSLFPVDVELSAKDRFLTLVVTDGQDPQERFYQNGVYPSIHSDWGMFIDPVLVLN